MRSFGPRVRVAYVVVLVSLAVLASQPLTARTTHARSSSPHATQSADAYAPVAVADPTEEPASEPDLQIWEPDASDPDARAGNDAGVGQADPVYVVADDEQLAEIATLFRVDPAAVLAANPGVDPDRLEPGQELLLPGGSVLPPPEPEPEPVAVPEPPPDAAPARQILVWPAAARGAITTYYSGRHQGIDIAASSGTAIRAVADGTVTWAGWKNNGGGYVVEIEHTNGMHSAYNHNQAVTVRVGQVVAAGDQIALMGMTGNATGPHLDFRIDLGGVYLNPLKFAWAYRPQG